MFLTWRPAMRYAMIFAKGLPMRLIPSGVAPGNQHDHAKASAAQIAAFQFFISMNGVSH